MESSIARSDAEQRPDHAGEQYVIFATCKNRRAKYVMMRLECRDYEASQCIQQTTADARNLVTWSVAFNRLLNCTIMLSSLRLLTRITSRPTTA